MMKQELIIMFRWGLTVITISAEHFKFEVVMLFRIFIILSSVSFGDGNQVDGLPPHPTLVIHSPDISLRDEGFEISWKPVPGYPGVFSFVWPAGLHLTSQGLLLGLHPRDLTANAVPAGPHPTFPGHAAQKQRRVLRFKEPWAMNALFSAGVFAGLPPTFA